jgi:endoglucanase
MNIFCRVFNFSFNYTLYAGKFAGMRKFLGMSFLGQLLTSKNGNAVEPVMPAAVTTRTPIATNGQLKVIGTQLCNEHDEPIQLKGLSSHGLQWFAGCLSSVSLNSLVTSFKADVFRIALYVQEGGYESDPVGFTNQVNQLIKETSDRGMYALVDWHILSPGDPTCNFDRARKFFTDIATANKGRNNLIYEIANEPNGVSWTTIKSYADRLIPIIRAIDPTSVILVGTPGWSSLGLSEGRNSHDIINAPINFPNIMYTFHLRSFTRGPVPKRTGSCFKLTTDFCLRIWYTRTYRRWPKRFRYGRSLSRSFGPEKD